MVKLYLLSYQRCFWAVGGIELVWAILIFMGRPRSVLVVIFFLFTLDVSLIWVGSSPGEDPARGAIQSKEQSSRQSATAGSTTPPRLHGAKDQGECTEGQGKSWGRRGCSEREHPFWIPPTAACCRAPGDSSEIHCGSFQRSCGSRCRPDGATACTIAGQCPRQTGRTPKRKYPFGHMTLNVRWTCDGIFRRGLPSPGVQPPVYGDTQEWIPRSPDPSCAVVVLLGTPAPRAVLLASVCPAGGLVFSLQPPVPAPADSHVAITPAAWRGAYRSPNPTLFLRDGDVIQVRASRWFPTLTGPHTASFASPQQAATAAFGAFPFASKPRV